MRRTTTLVHGPNLRADRMLSARRPARLAATWAMLALAAACGDGGSSTPGGLPAPSTTVTTAAPTSTLPTTTTVPKARTVAIGETFSAKVGESVSVLGAGLSVAFAGVVSDSRCPLGVQCIQAGNAVITVTVTRQGTGPVKLTLDTERLTTARAGNRSVELISLSRGQAPIVRLKVT